MSRRLGLGAALLMIPAGLARAGDTQTVISQANVTVTQTQSDALVQAAAGGLGGLSGHNMSTVIQTGNNNRASTDQTGYGNTAALMQTGSGNSAALVQNSDGGVISATQTGSGIGIVITQTGHAPAITITQTRPGR